MKVKKYIYLCLISIFLAAVTACTNGASSTSPSLPKPEEIDNPTDENPLEEIPEEIPEEKPVFQGTAYTEIPSDNPNFNGTYALFGDWPQTIKADDVNVDENVSVQMGGFTYYKGDDGAWYVKCKENACTVVTIPQYTNGEKVARLEEGKEKYFKVEPIKWRILKPKKAGKKRILVSDRPLMAGIIFNANVLRKLDGKTIYPNNYQYSNMRSYLNGIPNQFITDGGNATGNDIDWTGKGFLQTAFTEALQECISDTVVDNSVTSANPDKATINDGKNPYVCDKTYDKIFLLSLQEATTADYGFKEYDMEDSFRLLVPTDFARANNAFCHKSNDCAYWFLRSPNYGNTELVLDFNYAGRGMDSKVAMGDSVIVPALCLK